MKWQDNKRYYLLVGLLFASFLILSLDGRSEFIPKTSEDEVMALDWQYDSNNFTIADIAISADGNYIIAGGYNGTLDNENYPFHGRILFFSKNCNAPIWVNTSTKRCRSVDISDNGNYAVVGDLDNHTYLFETQSASPLHSFDTGYFIDRVEISGDGYYHVCYSNDTLYFFNRTKANPMWTFQATAEINDMALSQSGEYVVVGTEDGKVYLFNNSDSTPMWTNIYNSEITDVDISDEGETIVVGRVNYTHIFTTLSSVPSWSDNLYSDDLNPDIVDVSVSGNGKMIAVSPRNDIGLSVYEDLSSDKVYESSGHGFYESSFDFNGDFFTSCTSSDRYYVYSSEDSEPVWEGQVSSFYSISNTDISKDGSKVIFHGGSCVLNTQRARIYLYSFTPPNEEEEEKESDSTDYIPGPSVSFGFWFFLTASVAVVIILKRAKPSISK